jgi:hypothetical protein
MVVVAVDATVLAAAVVDATLSSRVCSARFVARRDTRRHAASSVSTIATMGHHISKLHR